MVCFLLSGFDVEAFANALAEKAFLVDGRILHVGCRVLDPRWTTHRCG